MRALNKALRTSFLQANGLEFHIGVAGAGSRPLFLTGTKGGPGRTNTPFRSPPTQHFEVLTYDQRGLGQSSKPDIPYTMLDYARDAIAIPDGLSWEHVHLVGYSFGGMVAQELAIGWPERVKRFVLCATAAGGDGGSSYPIQTLSGLDPVLRSRIHDSPMTGRPPIGTKPPNALPGGC